VSGGGRRVRGELFIYLFIVLYYIILGKLRLRGYVYSPLLLFMIDGVSVEREGWKDGRNVGRGWRAAC